MRYPLTRCPLLPPRARPLLALVDDSYRNAGDAPDSLYSFLFQAVVTSIPNLSLFLPLRRDQLWSSPKFPDQPTNSGEPDFHVLSPGIATCKVALGSKGWLGEPRVSGARLLLLTRSRPSRPHRIWTMVLPLARPSLSMLRERGVNSFL